MKTLLELNTASIAADEAWRAGYEAVCPKGEWPGDFRYTNAAKGEAGSPLRALYDERCRAASAAHDAWEESRRTA